jgi:hypothetical protein
MLEEGGSSSYTATWTSLGRSQRGRQLLQSSLISIEIK